MPFRRPGGHAVALAASPADLAQQFRRSRHQETVMDLDLHEHRRLRHHFDLRLQEGGR